MKNTTYTLVAAVLPGEDALRGVVFLEEIIEGYAGALWQNASYHYPEGAWQFDSRDKALEMGREAAALHGLTYNERGWFLDHPESLKAGQWTLFTVDYSGLLDRAMAALRVIAKTPHVALWLSENDPMALRQVQGVISELADSEPISIATHGEE